MSWCDRLLITLFLSAVCGGNSRQPLRMNKCCPKDKRLGDELNCVDVDPNEKEENSTAELSWFPVDSVVDSGTLKVHEHRFESYRRILRERYRIEYGKVPECGDGGTRQFAYFKTDLVEWFYYLVDGDGLMKVHVSKPSSFHDPDDDSIRALPLEDTCVDLGIEQVHVLMFCPCRTMPCVRKCCPDGNHFAIESFSCEENESHDPPPSWRPKMDGAARNYYLLSDTYPSCDVPILLKYHHEQYSSCNRFNTASDNQFTIFPNGSLKVRKYKTLFDSSQYCGEVTVSANGSVEEQNLILCSASKKEEDAYEPITHTLYGVLLVVGGICLLLTVSVSLVLPNLRRKVHNKIALSHNASLMIANFTWAVPQLSTSLSPRSCAVLAFLEQFTLLGSFFWLNVMCIDISTTFSSNRHVKSGRFNGGTKKFLYYCVYAWGSTGLISAITMVMEYHPGIDLDYLKPGLSCICGFNTGNASMLIYLYGPMSILLLVNLALFVYTTLKIMNIQRQTAMLHKTDSNTTGGSSFQSDRQRLMLYGKLFLLMGITWIMEIISWAVGGRSYYWYFSDILNLLRAVFIFVLFVCKRRIFRNLKRKLLGGSRAYSEKTGSARSNTDELAVSGMSIENRSSSGSPCTGNIRRNESTTSEMDFMRSRQAAAGSLSARESAM